MVELGSSTFVSFFLSSVFKINFIISCLNGTSHVCKLETPQSKVDLFGTKLDLCEAQNIIPPHTNTNTHGERDSVLKM